MRKTAAALLAIVSLPLCIQAETLCFEAEATTDLGPPMEKISVKGRDASDVSGAAYLAIKQGAGDPPGANGSAAIKFDVKDAGRYYLWCRVWWLDACGNSLGIHINDAAPFSFGQDRTFKSWHWVQAPKRLDQLKLSKGIKTLTISHREDGVRIDQILLTTNKRYVPVGIEEVTYKPPTRWPEFTPDGRTAHLPSRVGWEEEKHD